MKLLKLIFPVVLVFFMLQDCKTQDLHFSNYQMLPVQMNPALAGAFNGTARLSALTRGQWWSVAGGNPASGNGYNTIGLSLDSPIIRGLRKKDWVGVGIDYANDKAGAGDYSAGYSGINIAYHLSLDKKQTRVVTFGVKRASYTYSLNQNGGLISRPTLLGGMDGDLDGLYQNVDMNGNVTTSASDWAAGVVFTTAMGKTSDLRMGVSMSHLLKADKSFGNSGIEQTPRRLTLFGTIYNSLSKKVLMMPSLFIQRQNVTTEIQVQSIWSFLFKEENDLWLNAGLGLRPMNSTDLILFLGADIKDLKIGVSYDVNFAGFTAATGTVGALELGVSYIYKLFKKPKADPIMVCPRL